MTPSRYLHVHFPGRGQLTLALPDGLRRARDTGRLPADAEAWSPALQSWIPLAQHPDAVELLAPAEATVAVAAGCDEPVPSPEPVTRLTHSDLPLLVVGDWQEQLSEFSRMVDRSSRQEERRQAARNSSGVRRSGPAPVFVAGTKVVLPEPAPRSRTRTRRFPRRLVLTGVGVGLLLAVGALGIRWYRTPAKPPATASPQLANTQVGARLGEMDTLGVGAGGGVVVVPPNPLTDLEANLESDLRIAEAVVWQPALDFATREQVLRSMRKLNAVHNAISLYRLGAWRAVDSLSRENDPRLEPFAESEIVDSALDAMQAAFSLLDSLTGRYRLSGDYLVFQEPAQAVAYDALTSRAARLLATPAPADSFATPRAPRRIVSRLVETLPAAVIAAPQP